MDNEELKLWTVYRHPADYPTEYVTRLFINEKPCAFAVAADTLEEIRKPLREMGLTCIDRSNNDDPVIVEVWL